MSRSINDLIRELQTLPNGGARTVTVVVGDEDDNIIDTADFELHHAECDEHPLEIFVHSTIGLLLCLLLMSGCTRTIISYPPDTWAGFVVSPDCPTNTKYHQRMGIVPVLNNNTYLGVSKMTTKMTPTQLRCGSYRRHRQQDKSRNLEEVYQAGCQSYECWRADKAHQKRHHQT